MNRIRNFAFGLIPIALAAILIAAPNADGCAIMPREGNVYINSETAVIVHDSATKTEHFIRTASFQGTSADFGFLVPTPTKPELAESSGDLFRALPEITKRRVVEKWRAKELQLGCLMPMGANVEEQFSKVGAAFPGGGVRVVEQKRVGQFDAAILQADDPKLLREWLADNGYQSRIEMGEWLALYVKQKWYLTAFKIAMTGEAKPQAPIQLTNSAVRISFQTDKPIYPYREPADARSGGAIRDWTRQLKVFLLADVRMSATIGELKPWPAKTEWSNSLTPDRLASAFTAEKLPENYRDRNWHLTEFLDSSSPRPGTDELYFSKAEDQSKVEREPTIHWKEYDPWPWVFVGCVAATALLVVFSMARRWGKAKGAGEGESPVKTA